MDQAAQVTTRRCHGCAHWYDAREHACPECGTPKHAHNTGLVHARMNSALWKQTELAVKNS